jgi:hypothetical protein
MMPRGTFDVTCLACGADVELTATGTTNGHTTKAVVTCSECHREWLLTVSMALVSARHTPAKLDQLSRARKAA